MFSQLLKHKKLIAGVAGVAGVALAGYEYQRRPIIYNMYGFNMQQKLKGTPHRRVYENYGYPTIREQIGSKDDGKVIEYYDLKGKVRKETNYKNDRKEGKRTEYSHDGLKSAEKYFKNGELDGLCVEWNKAGIVSSQCEFSKNDLIKVISQKDDDGDETVLGEGELTVYKLCVLPGTLIPVYVTLKVPAHAKRVTPNSTQWKSRVEFAEVMKIHDKDGVEYPEANSFVHTSQFKYKVGETAIPDNYVDNCNDGCAGGINVHIKQKHCDTWLSSL